MSGCLAAAVARRPSIAALVVAVLLGLGGWLVTASPAAAHNVLRGTSPSDRSTVDRVPSEVILTFDEPALAMGTALVVTGPDGPVQDGPARLIDNTVRQALRPGAPAGSYQVEWRVTSADGHPVSGTFTFTARSAGAPGSAAAPSPAPSPGGDASGTTGHGMPGWLWVVVVVLLMLAGTTSMMVLRRRRSPH